MAIVAGDIQRRLSGGAGNADPNAALGGVISSTAIVDATLHNLFDLTSGDEAAAGRTEYRHFYFRNNHGTLTYTNSVVWIGTNTPASGDTIDIALQDEAVDVTAETIANETTAPSGPAFTAPTTKATGLALGSLPAAGGRRGIWVRRTTTAGATAYDADSVVIHISGETSA